MVEKYRLQVWYGGRVQGVGFRYKAAQIAKGFDVAGSVENLPDGRVLLVAVGEESEARAFAAELAKSMADFIRETSERSDFTSDSYRGFLIKL
ncbi:MAG: acylphosphatase [Verrucomicrobia bacterium]|nr:MAG: acylphosphatase [Verrucomicrobiota bacterium]